MVELKPGDFNISDYAINKQIESVVLESPVYKSQLLPFGDEHLIISYIKPMPNWWWRMWQYLLFGFKWKKIGE